MHAGRHGKQAGKHAGRQTSKQAGRRVRQAWQAGGSATDYRVIDYRSIIEGEGGRTIYGRGGGKGSGTEGYMCLYLGHAGVYTVSACVMCPFTDICSSMIVHLSSFIESCIVSPRLASTRFVSLRLASSLSLSLSRLVSFHLASCSLSFHVLSVLSSPVSPIFNNQPQPSVI